MMPAITVKSERGIILPRGPKNGTVATPASMIGSMLPSSVLSKVILALFDVMMLIQAILVGLEKIRGFAPVTVISDLISMSPALPKMRFVRGVTPPMGPPKKIVPDPAAKDKISAPLMVEALPKVILPFPVVELIVTELPKAMVAFKETPVEVVVVIVPEIKVVPLPSV